MTGAGRTNLGIGLGLGLLALAFAVDFHFDVRDRDVLSWLDPEQYYAFAVGVWQGREAINGFEVPSIYPFFLVPAVALEASIPAALWTQAAFTLLLLWAVDALCRELRLKTPSPLVAALVLSSPLLIGLSRTLYVEYALTAVVAGAFVLWLRLLRRPDGRSVWAFGSWFAVGCLMKMTFPLFLAAPAAAAIAGCWASGRRGHAFTLARALAVPGLLVVAIQAGLFPGSLGYYLSLGNTSLPIMALIGPPELLSPASGFFYLGEVGRSLLFLLTPFLLGAALAACRDGRGWRVADLAGARAALWLWLLGPLLLLVLQPVKEPRHVAPCVVPGVLLAVLAIERLAHRGGRRWLLAAAGALAAIQFLAVTRHRIDTPYFLDRSLHWQEVVGEMIGSDQVARYARTPEALRPLHWRYDQNVVIGGFRPNEALAVTWQLFPGVVYDLDILAAAERSSDRIPYRRFEDLYLLSAFNSYNRRCGWRDYYATLPPEWVVENAEFVLLAGDRFDPGGFPRHSEVARVAVEGGEIRVLRAKRPGRVPYRSSYARRFLARNPGLPPEETRVVARELWMAAELGGAPARARALEAEFPGLRGAGSELRNIYWLAGYDELLRLAESGSPEAGDP